MQRLLSTATSLLLWIAQGVDESCPSPEAEPLEIRAAAAFHAGDFVQYFDETLGDFVSGMVGEIYSDGTYDVYTKPDAILPPERLRHTDFVCPKRSTGHVCDALVKDTCTEDSLYHNGFVVIKNAVSNVEKLYASVKAYYEEMRELERLSGVNITTKYRDAVRRNIGRYDIALREGELLDQASASWASVEQDVLIPAYHASYVREQRKASVPEEEIQPIEDWRVGMSGILVTEYGASKQHWHRDGYSPHEHNFGTFISLTDVTKEMGPTEFLPHSNRDYLFYFTQYTKFFDDCETLEAPLPSAGDIIIWDYRTLHRGVRNEADPGFRPYLYRVYHLEGSIADSNFNEYYPYFHDTMREMGFTPKYA